MIPKIKKALARFDIALIALLAFGLRMVHFLTASYGVTGELFRDLNVVYSFVYQYQWPMLGPSSSLGGFNFGAVYYYLLTPFVMLFKFAPYGATFASIFFSTLQVVVLYYLILLWFGSKTWARLAAGMLAIAVFDIQFAYYASNPNFLPFFTLSFFYLLSSAKQKHFPWPLVLGAGAAFGVATQLHATALLALPVVLVLFLAIKKVKVPLKSALIFLAGLVFTYLPYLIFELSHNLENARGIAHLGEANFALSLNFFSLDRWAEFWSSLFLVRVDFFNTYGMFGLLAVGGLILTVALLVSAYFLYKPAFKTSWRELKANDGSLLLLLWTAACSVMFFFYQRQAPFFYFLVLWPLPVIIFAWFLTRLLAASKPAFTVILVWFALLQVFQLNIFYRQIYNPTLSFKNTQNLLYEISQIGGSFKYVIVNNFFDPTTFHYYLRLDHMEQTQQVYKPQNIFLLQGPDSEGVIIKSTEYSKIGQQQWYGLTLVQYRRDDAD